MELKQLLNDDRGVSPVIGVILMVAITVILAAVIGTFVLGLGSNVGNNAPSATFNYEYSGSFPPGDTGIAWVNITSQGGDSIDPTSLTVQTTADNGTAISIDPSLSTTNSSKVLGLTNNWEDPVQAGDTVNIYSNSSVSEGDNPNIGADEDVQIVWSSGDSSSIISTSTTPSS